MKTYLMIFALTYSHLVSSHDTHIILNDHKDLFLAKIKKTMSDQAARKIRVKVSSSLIAEYKALKALVKTSDYGQLDSEKLTQFQQIIEFKVAQLQNYKTTVQNQTLVFEKGSLDLVTLVLSRPSEMGDQGLYFLNKKQYDEYLVLKDYFLSYKENLPDKDRLHRLEIFNYLLIRVHEELTIKLDY